MVVQICFAELCSTSHSIQLLRYEISPDTSGCSTMAQKMACTTPAALHILAAAA